MFGGQPFLIKDIFSFAIGCCFGSFINVMIYRLPLNQSIIFPGSHCTKCNCKIHWHENIPLVSWIFLKGKCSHCKEEISLIYPIVEFFTGLLFIFNNYSHTSLLFRSSNHLTIVFGWILISILLTLSILDIKYFWLPNSICKIGLIFGILFSVIKRIPEENSIQLIFTLDSIAAALLGYIVFQMISAIGFQIFRKPAMGKGDANLAALIGSWLGVKGLGISIWLSFYIAGIFVIVGLISKKIKRKQKIPFGVFLAFTAMLIWQFGNNFFIQLMYLN